MLEKTLDYIISYKAAYDKSTQLGLRPRRRSPFNTFARHPCLSHHHLTLLKLPLTITVVKKSMKTV